MIADIAPAHISMRNGYMGPNYGSRFLHVQLPQNLPPTLPNRTSAQECVMLVISGSEAAITIAGMGGF